jgi:hypothetical protein
MKLEMNSTNRAIVAVVAVVALGIAFWMLALAPKRDEAKKLGKDVERVESSLAQHRAEVAEGLKARSQFAAAYQQLVVLGKAVPGDDDSASLLVQLNRIGNRAGAEFNEFILNSGAIEESAPAPPAPLEGAESTTASAPISPTEAAAATLPLGAKIGSAGFGVMPYTLNFNGDFFKIADFIKGLDSLVDTRTDKIAVDGRLVTLDGFVLAPDPRVSGSGEEAAGPELFPELEATFVVSTYVTPPSQGVTAGASPTAPPPATAVPASTPIGAAP